MHYRFSIALSVFLLSAAILGACAKQTGTVTILIPIKEPALGKSLGPGSAMMLEQIVDRQLLAEYQATFSTYADLPGSSQPKESNTVEQIADRSALAAYQATLSTP